MRARLGFAVIQLVSPSILLLDEVFEALDHEFRAMSRTTARDLRARGGIVVAAGHDHTALERIAPRAVWLDDGHVIERRPVRRGDPHLPRRDRRDPRASPAQDASGELPRPARRRGLAPSCSRLQAAISPARGPDPPVGEHAGATAQRSGPGAQPAPRQHQARRPTTTTRAPFSRHVAVGRARRAPGRRRRAPGPRCRARRCRAPATRAASPAA